MTQNEQNVTGTRSPQQVAADLFRIGENPGLPAWQYPVLQQAIAMLDGTDFAVAVPTEYTYASTQATTCAGCGEHKHTPLRIDRMGGYVCLTCIDRELERITVPSDDERAAVEFALAACAGHVAGERHVPALESLLSGSREAR